MKKKKDLRGLADAALVQSEFEATRELTQAHFDATLGRLEKSHSLKELRRERARHKTEVRRREIAASAGKDALYRQHGASYVPQSAELSGGESSVEEASAAPGLLASLKNRFFGSGK